MLSAHVSLLRYIDPTSAYVRDVQSSQNCDCEVEGHPFYLSKGMMTAMGTADLRSYDVSRVAKKNPESSLFSIVFRERLTRLLRSKLNITEP